MTIHSELTGVHPFQHHADWGHRGLVEVGLAANRPSSPGYRGRVYHATDTDVLSVWDGSAWVEYHKLQASGASYTVANGTTDRAYDADATTVDELADVLATLIADLKTTGVIQ